LVSNILNDLNGFKLRHFKGQKNSNFRVLLLFEVRSGLLIAPKNFFPPRKDGSFLRKHFSQVAVKQSRA
jgi:hypothetical protein